MNASLMLSHNSPYKLPRDLERLVARAEPIDYKEFNKRASAIQIGMHPTGFFVWHEGKRHRICEFFSVTPVVPCEDALPVGVSVLTWLDKNMASTYREQTVNAEHLDLSEPLMFDTFHDPIKLCEFLEKAQIKCLPEKFAMELISKYMQIYCSLEGFTVTPLKENIPNLNKYDLPPLNWDLRAMKTYAHVKGYFFQNPPGIAVGMDGFDEKVREKYFDYEMLSSFYGPFFLVDKEFFEEEICGSYDPDDVLNILDSWGYLVTTLHGRIWFENRHINPYAEDGGFISPGCYAIRNIFVSGSHIAFHQQRATAYNGEEDDDDVHDDDLTKE